MVSFTQPHTLPKSEYDEKCLISLDRFEDLARDKELVMASCGHKFSLISIANWIEQKGGSAPCPTCKKQINNNFIPIVLSTNNVAKDNIATTQSSANSLSRAKIKEFNGDLDAGDALKLAMCESQIDKVEDEDNDEEDLSSNVEQSSSSSSSSEALLQPVQNRAAIAQFNGDFDQDEAYRAALSESLSSSSSSSSSSSAVSQDEVADSAINAVVSGLHANGNLSNEQIERVKETFLACLCILLSRDNARAS